MEKTIIAAMRKNGSLPSRKTSRNSATRVLKSPLASPKSCCSAACHCVWARKSTGTGRRWLQKIVPKPHHSSNVKTVPAGFFPDSYMETDHAPGFHLEPDDPISAVVWGTRNLVK